MLNPLSALRPLSIGGADAGSAIAAMPGATGSAATQAGGADFASVLADVAASATEALRSGEAAAIAGVQGKASVQQVVEAVMSAEQSLQAAIAIRDKVIGAYQEISHMAI